MTVGCGNRHYDTLSRMTPAWSLIALDHPEALLGPPPREIPRTVEGVTLAHDGEPALRLLRMEVDDEAEAIAWIWDHHWPSAHILQNEAEAAAQAGLPLMAFVGWQQGDGLFGYVAEATSLNGAVYLRGSDRLLNRLGIH